MDVQLALLSKVVIYAELRPVVDARITLDFFTDDHYKRIYSYMLEHWRTYNVCPDAAVMKMAFPNAKWTDDPQPIEFFIDQLRKRRKHSILLEGLNEAAGFFQSTDPDAVDGMEDAIASALLQARLETSPSLDVGMTTSRTKINELLDIRGDDPGYLRGISTGFDGIDYVTGGYQPEQFIVMLGTPKSFKSATLLASAIAVHGSAHLPLFIGFEMSNTEQMDRTISLISGVSLTKIMTGALTLNERRKIDAALALYEGMKPFIFSTDISAGMTVGGVQAKIQEYMPDVVFIDGAYHMQSEIPNAEPGSAQALTNISRSLKRLAQSSKIPIVITTQASLHRSKSGITLMSAMYTQAWGQDADVLLGVERIGERQETESTTDPVQVKFKVVESRSGPRRASVLEWDWSRGRVREMTAAELSQHRPAGYTSDDGTEDWKQK
jgi:hypothetical protein